MGQAKNLAKGRDRSGQPKSGTGRAGTAKIRDGTRDITGQSRKGGSKTEKGCSKTENLVIISKKGTPGQEFVCPGTKEQRDALSWFVPGRPVPWKRYFRLLVRFSIRDELLSKNLGIFMLCTKMARLRFERRGCLIFDIFNF